MNDTSTLIDEHPKVHRQQPLLTLFAVVAIPASLVLSYFYATPWFLLLGGVGLLVLALMRLRAIGEKLVVTDDTLMVEKGILSKDRTEMSLTGIRSINVKQSFYERLVGIGTISVFTTGDDPESTISGIGSPHRIRETVNAAIKRDDGGE